MQSQCIHDLYAPCSAFRVFYLHTQTAVGAGDIGTWRTAVIFIMGKTRRPPIWAPGRDKDGAGSDLPFYICACDTCFQFQEPVIINIFSSTWQVAGEVVITEPYHACTEPTNAEEIKGKIALMVRGECMFIDKVSSLCLPIQRPTAPSSVGGGCRWHQKVSAVTKCLFISSKW